jgi:hypothetical protein
MDHGVDRFEKPIGKANIAENGGSMLILCYDHHRVRFQRTVSSLFAGNLVFVFFASIRLVQVDPASDTQT